MKAQELYVGTNYHPHDDKNIEKIRRNIQLMKDEGFTVVRMGHLGSCLTKHSGCFYAGATKYHNRLARKFATHIPVHLHCKK